MLLWFCFPPSTTTTTTTPDNKSCSHYRQTPSLHILLLPPSHPLLTPFTDVQSYTKAAATAAAPPSTPITAGAAVGRAKALLAELDPDLAAEAVAELALLDAELWAEETAEVAEAAAEETLLPAEEATLETALLLLAPCPLDCAAAREPSAMRMRVRNCIVKFEFEVLVGIKSSVCGFGDGIDELKTRCDVVS